MRCWPWVLVSTVAVGSLEAAELRPETLEAWTRYQRLTEARIQAELSSPRGFLVEDFLPPAEAARGRALLADGKVFVFTLTTRAEGGKSIEVPDGLIHHWAGSIRVPGATLATLLPWVQDYARHQDYFDEVERSRLLSRDGDVFKIFFRLRRKKVITVYYATEHTVEYRRHDARRASSRSNATKIAELEEPGTLLEREKPAGKDSGFLWRLNSYWRFEEKEGGVVVECESISLSRSIPTGLGWIVGGYVQSIPRESLENTLASLRDGFQGKKKKR